MKFLVAVSLLALVSHTTLAQDESQVEITDNNGEAAAAIIGEQELVAPSAALEDVPAPPPPPPVGAGEEAQPKKEKASSVNNDHHDAIRAKLEDSGISTNGLKISSSIGQGLTNYFGGIGNSIVKSKTAVQKYTVTTQLANGKKFVCTSVDVKTSTANVNEIKSVKIGGCSL